MNDAPSPEPGSRRQLGQTPRERTPSGVENDLTQSLHQLAQLATGDLALKDTLTKVAEYAVTAIPGAEGAGLTFIDLDESETLVATAGFVSDVDSIQYGLRQGPCVSAASEGRTVMSSSLGDDDRWPDFGSRVALLGVHSALSLPLITSERVIGAMNIYARSGGVFDDTSADVGQLFAAPAAIAVLNAQVLAQAKTLVSHLQSALDERAVIDRAIGILVGRQGISTDEALSRLQTFSRNHHQNLVEVAGVTVERAARSRRPKDL